MPTVARVLYSPDHEAERFLPEGPRTTTIQGREAIMWVNIQTSTTATTGELHWRYFDNGEHGTRLLPDRPGFWFPKEQPGAVVVGMGKKVVRLSLERGDTLTLATIPDASPHTIINDGEIVPGGQAIIFGTKDTRFAEAIGHLYYLDLRTNALTVLADGQTCSNGKVFRRDADGLLLYDIDTPRKVVTKYRLDTEAKTPRITELGIAVDLRSRDDFPDGMCDCGDGTVIIAFYNPQLAEAGRAVRFSLATGEILDEWLTPGSPRVTCPLLVQRDRVELILTTAVEGMPAEMRQHCPNAGSLFIADTTLPGIPPAQVVKLSHS